MLVLKYLYFSIDVKRKGNFVDVIILVSNYLLVELETHHLMLSWLSGLLMRILSSF